MNSSHSFLDRRRFLQVGLTGTLGMVAMASGLVYHPKRAWADSSSSLDPDTALQKLMEGNQRFAQHHPQYPDQTQARLQEVAQAQHPFATVLSCADSRVPVELLFDQGVGDIFDVRVAGNISTPETVGSIEYAVALLGTPVLMVLGHERCGAVTAAVDHEVLPGDIGSFIDAILPAVDRSKGQSGDAVENAVVANVRYQMEQVGRSPMIRDRLRSGALKLVGGRYDLDTGRVTLIA